MPEFNVEFRIEGTSTMIIKAASLEEAKAKADAMIEDDNWFPDLENISSADHYTQQLYRVKRKDGSVCKTTYVRPDDKVLADE